MKIAMLVGRIVAAILLLLGYGAAYFRFKQGNYLIGEAVLFTILLFLFTVAFTWDWVQAIRKRDKP